jgi:mRNA interferase MazF
MSEAQRLRRGDIWTFAGGEHYAGKPRPAVIIQDECFDATDSITICAFTTDETDAPLFRLPVQPSERNGLRAACRLMVDKISTVPKTKIGARVGRLDNEDIMRLNQAVIVFLGLAASPRDKVALGHSNRLQCCRFRDTMRRTARPGRPKLVG